MDGSDGASERRVWAKIDLVVDGDEEAEGKGSSGAGERGGVELSVYTVDDTGSEGEVEDSTEPFASSWISFGGCWFA